jgi:ribonucleotide reductase beta subunit family protein with ferritin-like domain
MSSYELLLSPEEKRLTVFPIKYHDIWNLYKKMQAAHWTAEEIDWAQDKYDYDKLNDNEKKFIKYVLAFFATSDTLVNDHLGERLAQEVQIQEAQIAYRFQMAMESVHAETYALQIENIIKDEDEKREILNAIETVPCIKQKADWLRNWIKSDAPFATRLFAQAIMEGVFFSGSFCAIFWLKHTRNIMPGLISSNEFIARDEGMHTELSCMLYNMLENKLSNDEAQQMIKDAVDIEIGFINDSLPCRLLGMNADSMTTYIKFVADRLLITMGYEKIWNLTNPFSWMQTISMEGKTNFFENRPTQYQKAAVLNETKYDGFVINNNF